MNTMQGADPTKVTGRRFGAFIIDWVILGSVVPLLIFLAISRPTIYTDEPGCDQLELIELVASGDTCVDVNLDENDSSGFDGTYVYPSSGSTVATVFQLAYLIGVLWIVQGISGVTLGKLLFGIRTVNEAGTGPGLGKQFIRGVLWIADAILCGIPILAAAFIVATKRHQRIGDLAAGTFVVKASARGIPVPAATAIGGGAAVYNAGGVAPSTYPSAPPSDASAYPASPPMAAPAPDFATPADPTIVQPVVGATDPTTITGPSDNAPSDSTTAASPATGGPQWDPARNAYIQWDEARQSWLVYDDAAGEWKPIS